MNHQSTMVIFSSIDFFIFWLRLISALKKKKGPQTATIFGMLNPGYLYLPSVKKIQSHFVNMRGPIKSYVDSGNTTYYLIILCGKTKPMRRMLSNPMTPGLCINLYHSQLYSSHNSFIYYYWWLFMVIQC